MVTLLPPSELTKAQIDDVDSHMKELAEMLPYANPDTRKDFLKRINHLLDRRLELMKEGEKC